MEKMTKKTCVYGLGGIGGYLGGMLAQSAGSDNEVYFVARGKHLAAVREKGLTLTTPSRGSVVCHPTQAVEQVDGLPVMDVIFLCVKGYDLEEAVNNLNRIADENTVIIAPLNGVDIYERIKSGLTGGIVLPSCIFITSSIVGPGEVHHKGGTTRLVLGKDPEKTAFVPETLLGLLDEAEIPYQWEEDALPIIWEKFIMFAPFALVTAHTGMTFGQVMEDQETKEKVRAIMEEVVALAGARGIAVKEGIIEQILGNAGFYPYETKTSYQRDVESGKGKDEGDLIGGTILRWGQAHGISTVHTEQVYNKR